jgi:hypothetical protein
MSKPDRVSTNHMTKVSGLPSTQTKGVKQGVSRWGIGRGGYESHEPRAASSLPINRKRPGCVYPVVYLHMYICRERGTA